MFEAHANAVNALGALASAAVLFFSLIISIIAICISV